MSLIAVLIPLLFMGDIVGRLFREFAVTLAVTILISAVGVADADADDGGAAAHAHAAGDDRAGSTGGPSGRSNGSSRVTAARSTSCSGIRRRCWSASLATLALTVRCCSSIVPKGFFPIQDTGVIQARLGGRADRVVSGDDEAPAAGGRRSSQGSGGRTSLSSFVGIDQTNTTLNNGRLLINLKPLEQRDANATAIIAPTAAGS